MRVNIALDYGRQEKTHITVFKFLGVDMHHPKTNDYTSQDKCLPPINCLF